MSWYTPHSPSVLSGSLLRGRKSVSSYGAKDSVFSAASRPDLGLLGRKSVSSYTWTPVCSSGELPFPAKGCPHPNQGVLNRICRFSLQSLLVRAVPPFSPSTLPALLYSSLIEPTRARLVGSQRPQPACPHGLSSIGRCYKSSPSLQQIREHGCSCTEDCQFSKRSRHALND